MFLKCIGIFKKAHAAFDQGRGFEDLRGELGGGGGNLSSSLMAFFNLHVIDIFTTYWHFTRRGTLGLRPFIETIQPSPTKRKKIKISSKGTDKSKIEKTKNTQKDRQSPFCTCCMLVLHSRLLPYCLFRM